MAERLDSVLSTTTLVRSASCSADARRLVAEVDLAVGLVGGQDEVVLARQRGRPLVQRQRRHGGRRVVRVVEPQQPDARPGRRRHGVEVRQEAVLGQQRQLEHLPAREQRAALRHRVAGRRHRDERRRRAPAASEKIASLEPSVGTTSVRRVERDAEAPRAHAATASRSSGSPSADG